MFSSIPPSSTGSHPKAYNFQTFDEKFIDNCYIIVMRSGVVYWGRCQTLSARRSDVGGHVTVAVERVDGIVTDTAVLTDATHARRRQI